MVATNRILIIVTNADVFEKVGFRTGLWLGELVEFWEVAEEAGYKMDIASPAGGKVPIDPESLLMTEIGDAVGLKGGLSKRYEDKAFMSLLDDTLKVSDVDAGAYDAIYMTGGHGVMFDFPTSIALAELVARFYESGKIVSAVCHGPCGLLEARLSSGEYLLYGKNVTGYSWKEEILAKRDHAVSFSLEEELQKRGARYTKAAVPFGSHVVEDGRLVTGQNPRSAKDVGKVMVRKLRQTPR
ncbi:type 1 glutamine amidotransferase domain-containing protein [Burkholderia multivorans]|uniref:type 1 glutamine amidotransferase domain-containing protein n=1 Tax=Burkholderia multivorans TaxID=87883 RepID=UPI0021C0172B|nr:type 1 glutamine amidotransferase domain-containing protein [Burkholderia multivorans]